MGIDDRLDMAEKPNYVVLSPRLVVARKGGTDEKIVESCEVIPFR